MNIIFLTIAYPISPSRRNIYSDLVNEFSKLGHNVYVVTASERKYRKRTSLDVEDGVNVLRVRTGNIQKTNVIEKGISMLLIENQYMKAIKEYFSNVKFDLILYSTPPITFNRVISYIKKKDGASSYLLLKDIFPQNAIDIGLMKENGLLFKYFKKKEANLYRISDYIGCMSKANVEYLIKQNDFIDQAKVEVCPNSIRPSEYPLDKSQKQKIREKYNIPINTLVFVYGGNLGKPQGINFLADIIISHKNRKDCFFAIVGSGTEYKFLKDTINKYKLQNTILLPFMPKDEYDDFLLACDVGMIFLDPRFTIPNFPSRLLSYMDLGMPVIAATDICTDIKDVIENGQFGLWCKNGDLKTFDNYIDYLINNRNVLESMGKKSREYLESNYTVSKSCKIILKHFDRS